MRSFKIFSLLIALLFIAGSIVANPRVSTAQIASVTQLAPPNFSSSSLPSALKGPGPVLDYALAPQGDQTPGNILSYSPSEIREEYNSTGLLQSGITGKGITIAIVDPDGDPNITNDLHQFDATFGIPNPPSFHVICIDGPCDYESGILSGASVEIELDVEWSHAMAPGANINLYISSTFANGPLYDAELAAVLGASGGSENSSVGIGTPGVYHNDIISNSWGEPENNVATSQSYGLNYDPVVGGPQGYPWLDQVFQEAAARNITVFASSGDFAAYQQGSPYLQTVPYGGVSNPSDDPFVTAVGGTSVYLNTTGGTLSFPGANATGSYGAETAWSWINLQATKPGYQGGSTGGFSSLYPQPYYQRGPGVPNNGKRGNPDVSWLGDPNTGVLVYGLSPYTGEYSFYDIGGTSVGSPNWAGTMALLDQDAGRSLGFMNPTFYSILNNPQEYAKAFHEITFGNNNGFSAGPGWNPVTGMGTPNIGELANIVAGETPSLDIRVANNISTPVQFNSSTPAYSYGETIKLTASIDDHMQVSGPVQADITSLAGGLIASNIPMTWDNVNHDYVGTFQITSSDDPGQWLATVWAFNSGRIGVGYNAFAVGDSIFVFSPLSFANTGVSYSNFYTRGEIVPLAMSVENPNDTKILGEGHYYASFYFNTPSGKLEGTTDLKYNATTQMFEGSFKIPLSADQGGWVVTFTGVDKHGNRAAIAYSWLNVGLFIFPYTDTSSYVLGNTISIYAVTGVATGSFKATISQGSTTIGVVHLSLLNASETLWGAAFKVRYYDPTGFYNVTVSGDDGVGDRGSSTDVVRVAPYTMKVNLKLSSAVIALNGGEETISVRVINGNGLPLDVVNVQAYISLTLANGTVITPISNPSISLGLPLTYNSATHSFIGRFFTNGHPTWLKGKYAVEIIAYDPIGDYGNTTGTFAVA